MTPLTFCNRTWRRALAALPAALAALGLLLALATPAQAEYGEAAHWKYKEGLDGHDKLDVRLAWVCQLLENQRVSEDSGNLLHDLKSDLLPEEVFAFTPKGDVINLPTGATCIDFA